MGLTPNELLDNVRIQELLTEHANNPAQINHAIEDKRNGGQMIKIHNLQALISQDKKPADSESIEKIRDEMSPGEEGGASNQSSSKSFNDSLILSPSGIDMSYTGGSQIGN